MMRESEIYSTEIPLCPLCQADCLDFFQISDELGAALLAKDEELAMSFVVCPHCRVVCLPDDLNHRTEYTKQIHHVDDAGGLLIEIQRSGNPTMDLALSYWYRWEDNRPVLDTTFAGIDDQFLSLMVG